MPSRPETETAFLDSPWRVPLPLLGLLIAGTLVGLGVILWIAANWQEFGKAGRFALVAATIAASGALSVVAARLRVPAALLGLFAIGGLFALFGQTYQSSANAYELFAIWAAVALPWVVAARHDAVWCFWVVIAFTALPLWITATGAFYRPSAGTVLTAWGIAVALSAVLSPWSRLDAWTGATRWAFRLAVVLTLALVVSYALPAIAARHLGLVGVAGLVLAAGAVVGFARLRPFDLALLTAATFALDVLIIYALSSQLLRGMSDFGHINVFLIGLISAGVMAGSAVALLKIAAAHRAAGPTTGANTAAAAPAVAEAGAKPASDTHSNPNSNPWPVAVLSGLGALLTAVPVIAFLGLTLGASLFRGPATYIAGIAVLVGAGQLIRTADAISFRQQLAFIGLVIGMLLVSFALFRDIDAAAAALVMLAVCGTLAWAVPVGWIASLLGAIAAGFLVFALARMIDPTMPADTFTLAYLAAASIGAVGLVLAHNFVETAPASSAPLAARGHGFAAGWCGGLLIALMAGNPSFLVSQNFGRLVQMINSSVSLDLTPRLIDAAALCVVGLGVAWLVRRSTAWRRPAALAICAAVAVLAYVRAPIAGAFAIFAAAVTTRHRALTYLSGFAIIWLIGSFYYWLGWPLIAKAYLLAALGLALGSLILMTGDRKPEWRAQADASGPSASMDILLASILTGLSVLATTVTVGSGIWQNETILAQGRRVFIKLAPVDPRSLMRGDYMALNFTTPRLPRVKDMRDSSDIPAWAVARVDANDIATVERYAYPGAQNIAGDLVLKINVQQRRVVIGTNAFFFEEGQGEKYAKARFGEFRVGAHGKPILVGLADENLQRID